MSKSDLRGRPVYHRKRDSIEAHWSIKRFVRTSRRYKTIQIGAGQHTLTADA